MRDDLHKTVSLASHWRRVLKRASRPADRDRVAQEIVRAIDKDMAAGVRPDWLRSLGNACVDGPDLFGTDATDDRLAAMARSQLSRAERDILEIARGQNANPLARPTLASILTEARSQIATRQVEHVVAVIRREFGAAQATEVDACLRKCSRGCDFTAPAPSQESQAGDRLLDLVIPSKGH